MPRRPRFHLPEVPLHVIQRGNNRQACFFADDDRRYYLHWLQGYARKFDCVVHAWVLMSNHVHLLMTPGAADSASRLMQSLGRRYVQYFNRKYCRTGTLWEGRFRASLVDAEGYLLRCHRYIELNPVRAGLVRDPADYRWSSYAANAGTRPDGFTRSHEIYMRLGADIQARRFAYRQLFQTELDQPLLAEIRASASRGVPLGGERIREQIEAMTGRKLQRKVGRPKKSEAEIRL